MRVLCQLPHPEKESLLLQTWARKGAVEEMSPPSPSHLIAQCHDSPETGKEGQDFFFQPMSLSQGRKTASFFEGVPLKGALSMGGMGSRNISLFHGVSLGRVLLETAAPRRGREAARELIRGENQSGVYANGRMR